MVSSRGFPQQAHHVAEHRLDLYHLYLCRLPCSRSMGNVTQYEDIALAPRNYGLSKKEVDARVNHALDAIDIQYLRNKQIYKMSSGEKKLVSIATILSMTPDVILMDEPSIALDPRNRRRLIQLLNSFSQIKIIASHDIGKTWIGTAALLAKNNKIRRNFVNKCISLCYDKNIKRAL